jgi:hypothetical protein
VSLPSDALQHLYAQTGIKRMKLFSCGGEWSAATGESPHVRFPGPNVSRAPSFQQQGSGTELRLHAEATAIKRGFRRNITLASVLQSQPHEAYPIRLADIRSYLRPERS